MRPPASLPRTRLRFQSQFARHSANRRRSSRRQRRFFRLFGWFGGRFLFRFFLGFRGRFAGGGFLLLFGSGLFLLRLGRRFTFLAEGEDDLAHGEFVSFLHADGADDAFGRRRNWGNGLLVFQFDHRLALFDAVAGLYQDADDCPGIRTFA